MIEVLGTTPGSPEMTIEGLFLRSASAAPRLRIGLLGTSGKLPAPAAQIIQNLRACDFLEIIASITVAPHTRLQAPSGPAFYRLYRWWDELTHAATTHLLAPRDCADLLSTVAAYTVASDSSGSRLVPSEAQNAALKSCRLDVILALGCVPNPVELTKVARFGVWSIQIGDPLLGDREPRQFWNMVRRSVPPSISLTACTADRPAPITLTSGTLPLESAISIISNLVGPARVAERLVLAKLWQLHRAGWDHVLAHCSDADGHDSPDSATPTNWQMLAWIVPRVLLQLRHRLKLRHTAELWRVGIRLGSHLEGLQAATTTTGLSWLEAPRGHYYADPFAIAHLGQAYLFVEDFDVAANKGWIVCLQLDQAGTPGPAQVVLERPYHLSYPQVFAHDGDKFMIPESGDNNTVELYRAVSFPTRWELARVLFHGPAFDTTVLHHVGLFWFFVTLIDSRFPQCLELLLFYSASLSGDWTLHPASPISTDIRVARCAGALFMDRGSWIRPAQDGSETYGGALRFQRIVRIDTRQYLEEPAGSVTAHMIRGTTGVHTYNRDGDLEVIDVKSRVDLRAHPGPLPQGPSL